MNIKEVNNYHRYRLNLAGGKISYVELKGTKVNHFIQPVTNNDPKLYVIKSKSKIIYIGITSQSIRVRLRYGLNAKGERLPGGYYGYKWKNLSEVEILIWCFTGSELKSIEGIEGELVYLARHKTGKWPEYQMEIHFHNCTEEEQNIAKAIYDESIK